MKKNLYYFDYLIFFPFFFKVRINYIANFMIKLFKFDERLILVEIQISKVKILIFLRESIDYSKMLILNMQNVEFIK